jgi:thymidylate synthase
MKSLSAIFALNNLNGFSNEGKIPWICKEDLNFFREKTTPSTLILGRKTWESMGRKTLKDRKMIVVTSTPSISIPEITFAPSLDAAISLSLDSNIFIIGGVQLLAESLKHPLMDKVYVSRINDSSFCSQTFFPDLTDYDLTAFSPFESFYVETYERKENQQERKYLDLMSDILNNGHLRETRNAKTYSLFGKFLEFDLAKGFPLLTTKKMFLKGVVEELLFFLRGETDSKKLEEKGVNIWKPNTSRAFLDKNGFTNYKEGTLGPMYGFNWRYFGAKYTGCESNYSGLGKDQFLEIIDLLKTDRFSRRILMTTYNPLVAKEGVLYPCHGLTAQFGVEGENRLCCYVYIRSNDEFLGFPFNLASYALLVQIICELVNNETENPLELGKLFFAVGDAHIYEEHVEMVKEQLMRTPFQFPTMKIGKKFKDVSELSFEDFLLTNYRSHPSIKAKMIA